MRNMLGLSLLLFLGLTEASFEFVTFLPPTTILGYSGAQNTQVFDPITRLPNVRNSAQYCETRRVNVSTAANARIDGLTYMHSPFATEVFCRTTSVTGGSSPTECDLSDSLPCSLEDVKRFDPATIARYELQEPLEYSFTACAYLDPEWYTNSTCEFDDTCNTMGFNDRLVYCPTCAYDCEFSIQCRYTTGVPPLPYAQQANYKDIIGCLDENNCRYYSCSQQQRVSSTKIDVIVGSVYTKKTEVKEEGPQRMSVCTSSASVYFNTSTQTLETTDYHPHACTFKCRPPWATSSVTPMPECYQSNGTTYCHPYITQYPNPGAHDKHCTINAEEFPENVCLDGGEPVSYKSVTTATAMGLEYIDPVDEQQAEGALKICSGTDNIACEDYVCVCSPSALGCPKSNKCTGKGRYHEGDLQYLPDYALQPVCNCEAGSYTDTCQATRPAKDVNCNRGHHLN